MSKTLHQDRPILAFLFILISSFGFALTNTFIKELGQTYGTMQTVFFRTGINFVILLPFWIFLPYTKHPVTDRLIAARDDFRVLITRSVAGFFALCCFFFAIPRLPLSISNLLYNLSPAFVILFSKWFLKESVSTSVKVGGIGAFVGLTFLLGLWQPLHADFFDTLFFGSVATLGAACAGAAQLAVRAATARVGVTTIVLFFTGISALLSLPFALATWVPIELKDVWKILLTGSIATLAQLFMTQGYRIASAGYVSVLMLMNVPFSLLIGYFYFKETLTSLQYLGITLLLIALTSMVWSSTGKNNGLRKLQEYE